MQRNDRFFGPLVLDLYCFLRANEEESVIARAPGIWPMMSAVASCLLDLRWTERTERGLDGTRRERRKIAGSVSGKAASVHRTRHRSRCWSRGQLRFEESIARASRCCLRWSCRAWFKSFASSSRRHTFRRFCALRCAYREHSVRDPFSVRFGLCMVQPGNARFQQERLVSPSRALCPDRRNRREWAEFIGELIGVPFSDKNSLPLPRVMIR